MDDKKSFDMSVEDILLEHEMKKKTGSSDAAKASASTPPVKDKEAVAPVKPHPPRSAAERFANKADEDADMKVIPSTKAEMSEEQQAVQKKKEEDTRRIPVFRPAHEEVTPKTVAVSMHTRVLSVAPPPSSDPLSDTQELYGQIDGQMVMENFLEEEMDEEAVEEELLRRRREKIKEFRIIEGGKSPEPEEKENKRFKLVGEEEESDAEDVLPVEEEPPEELLEDFNEYAEADAIRSELAYRCRIGGVGVIATVVIECVLLALTALYYLGAAAVMTPAVLLALHIALLVGMLCVNHRMVGGGIKRLLTFRADADTPPAVCGVLGLIYTATQFAQTAQIADGRVSFLSAAAGLALLAGALGRQVQIIRIQKNFGFVGNEKQKKNVATAIEDRKVTDALGYPDGENGMPRVVYYRRVTFLSQFLDTSYAYDPADRVMRWFAPLVLGVSVLCAVGFGLLFPERWDRAWLVFVSAVMLCMPSWSMFAVQRAMARSCRKALRKGAMIGGFAAAEQFGDRTKAVILEAADLFPKDQVKLHGIKTFSGTRIDEAITDAAAVMIAARGPLSPIFHRLIENRTDILREVDSLAYEQDMGLSGWVGGRRVLIGNRRLLENHGVDVPTRDYEARYVRDDRCVVYLSTGGELSAMFVVSYLANEAIKKQLGALEREHIRIAVRTCDPNITDALMCRVMDLPVRSVEVLSAGEGRIYESLLVDTQVQRADAVLACGGHAVSKAFGIVQSCRMRRGVWAALISQLTLSILAMMLCLFISATTGIVLKAPMLLAAMVVYGVVGWLIGRLFRT